MTTNELIEALRKFDPTGDAIVLPWSATPGGDCDPITLDPNDKSGVMLFYTPYVCLRLLKPSKGTMKYIRTKDGIFEVIGEHGNFVRVKFSGTQGTDIHKEMIRKQSNDIGKLFDEVVVKEKNREVHYSIDWFRG